MSAAWLFGKRTDLAVFGGSAALSFGALAIGALTGDLHQETPSWAWVPAIVLCDVAHVWATAFRTYLDPTERQARARLFTVVPIAGLVASVGLCAVGEKVFWRALAYLAIFHFVRQQYGWVTLYRARAGETDRPGKIADSAAIYAATLWPLLYWHTHLPRRFAWFVPGDIVALPSFVLPVATVLYVAALGAYAVRSARAWWRRDANPGKDLVVATTAVGWFVGMVLFDSDYAFTVTNVFMHGVPYFALVFVHAAGRSTTSRSPASPRWWRAAFGFVGVLWLVAFFEEMLWDRAVWHERAWLFGDAWDMASVRWLLVPLLALPQLVHYVLDGFVWRRRTNPSVAALVTAAR